MLAASLAARAEAIRLAVEDRSLAWHGTDPATLDFRDGIVSGPPGKVRLADVMGRHGVAQIQQSATASPGDVKKTHSLHAFGAQFAEVRVDPDFGTIRVSRWVGAFDCGKLLNAKTAESQLKGGIVFGIGMALLEETRTDAESGRIVNANIADYLVPGERGRAGHPHDRRGQRRSGDDAARHQGHRRIADRGRRARDCERGLSRDGRAGAATADPA